MLDMWVIYENPSDYPGKFVVRLWHPGAGFLEAAKDPTAVVETLEEARKAIPEGRHRLPRQASDDPVIVETWM